MINLNDPILTAAAALRDQLLQLDPTGEKGFEGLIADAIVEITGLVIRLAKSGVQGGRDGSSLHGEPFAVATAALLQPDHGAAPRIPTVTEVERDRGRASRQTKRT